jgi:hypothetical protein
VNASLPLNAIDAPQLGPSTPSENPSLDTLLVGVTARGTMADGKRFTGRVVAFDGRARVLDFACDGVVPPLPIAFSELRSLEVLAGPQPDARPGPRRCLVEFADGSALALAAAMVAECGYGLFVFGPGGGSSLRWFFPNEALARFTVGNAAASPDTPKGWNGGESGPDVCTPDQLRAALERHRLMRHLRIGDALVQEGLITIEQRDHALAVQKTQCHKQLGTILVEAGMLDPVKLRRVLVMQLGVPRVNLDKYVPDGDALSLLPSEFAWEYRIMPLRLAGARLAVALEDPLDWATLRTVETFTGLKVDPVLVSCAQLELALKRHYPMASRDVA